MGDFLEEVSSKQRGAGGVFQAAEKCAKGLGWEKQVGEEGSVAEWRGCEERTDRKGCQGPRNFLDHYKFSLLFLPFLPFPPFPSRDRVFLRSPSKL